MKQFLIWALSLSFTFVSAYAGEATVPFRVGVTKDRPLKKPRKVIPIYRTVEYNPERLVVLRGVVDASTTRPAIDKITELDMADPSLPIYFVINSPGGSVADGAEVMQVLESVSATTICMIETEAFSMGALIAVYCDKVYIHKFAMMMFHEASYGVRGSETVIQTQVAATQAYLDQLFADVAKQMGMTLPAFRKMIKHDLWLTAEEAVRWGFADAIINELKYPAPPPPPAPGFPFFSGEGEEESEPQHPYKDIYYTFSIDVTL